MLLLVCFLFVLDCLVFCTGFVGVLLRLCLFGLFGFPLLYCFFLFGCGVCCYWFMWVIYVCLLWLNSVGCISVMYTDVVSLGVLL